MGYALITYFWSKPRRTQAHDTASARGMLCHTSQILRSACQTLSSTSQLFALCVNPTQCMGSAYGICIRGLLCSLRYPAVYHGGKPM